MKIQKLYFAHLTNSEHFQFHTEFRNLVNATAPDKLKIAEEFVAYIKLYNQEDEVLKKIVKSEFTEAIQAADQKRDAIFRGMSDINRGMTNHFIPEIQAAAKRLQIVFDTYGDLAKRPLHQETADIYNFVQDLQGKYKDDMHKVNLADWTTELDRNNKEFDKLVNERYDESASKTTLVMREVRLQLDAVYRSITERVAALFIVEKAEVYTTFMHRLNVVIDTYNNLIAQRAGRNKNKKE
jgi:hypothetical protein